ncbi:ABC transporter ATP-binding protein [Schleiferilactobacillus perolens]|jgi:putative ABC transport system ATP-binding protein|uniref:ABC superfamily ATP binding cassette transporter, binding protein n=1 Tax=Schleiferilactobacillus perolens DSM 12744 TaxID=1423792 RepID=A0A0R1N384_9LACO|nr:ABC transporter ATP-binding protein [Schleiferilactobacillus perolens]KRL14758.1 ABC superfamily ATP binding cassette transporter, binding protein [Schleiferilactobacillus perolens DSM 12744]MCI1892149.1 ABC transporter ATP-binding protein [Schleiferilactobacillus harbinensis]MCI1912439.1 ABC transporter ATP-binding protein [Schleiferilactobacillus harbinensis]MCI2171696.1 ABC transporter ATP-binding protein [Schleiferilactobacillus perolens]
MSILTATDLTKQYSAEELPALDHANLSIEAGEFVAIVGPSGSGKSTLLHMLGGVDKPTSGTVHLYDTNVFQLNETQLAIFRRRQVGLIYQFYNLLPTLTVEENITLPADLDGQKVPEKEITELLAILGLSDKRTALPTTLSGGQQQRVAIGRALINHPAIVLADEPTGNLDQRNSQDIMDLLRAANTKRGQTLVVITHDPDIAAQADRVMTITDGKLTGGEPDGDH